jgi:flagellar motor component MotA
MTQHAQPYEQEDKEVTRSRTLAVCAGIFGGILIAGGMVAEFLADMTNTHAIAGGYCAIGVGATIGVIGGVAALNHAVIMRRQRHLNDLMNELIREHGETRTAIGLAVKDQLGERRSSG